VLAAIVAGYAAAFFGLVRPKHLFR
jgi:hypothetical protein